MSRVYTHYLIVANNGSLRVNTRRPARLKWNEVAFRLNLRVPDAWGRVQERELTMDMPEPCFPTPMPAIDEEPVDVPVEVRPGALKYLIHDHANDALGHEHPDRAVGPSEAQEPTPDHPSGHCHPWA